LILFAASAFIVPAPQNPPAGLNRQLFTWDWPCDDLWGIGFVQVGRWLARSEREVIHSFLKTRWKPLTNNLAIIGT